MADDIQKRMQALWQAAEDAILADVSYSIAMAEASSAARAKQQQQIRELVPVATSGV